MSFGLCFVFSMFIATLTCPHLSFRSSLPFSRSSAYKRRKVFSSIFADVVAQKKTSTGDLSLWSFPGCLAYHVHLSYFFSLFSPDFLGKSSRSLSLLRTCRELSLCLLSLPGLYTGKKSSPLVSSSLGVLLVQGSKDSGSIRVVLEQKKEEKIGGRKNHKIDL